MINKKTFIFNTLADVLKYKIGADTKNATYRKGSFDAGATIYQGEPDIPYYAEIFIRETNQMWCCNQFWLNDVNRSADNDLATEHAERVSADNLLQSNIDTLSSSLSTCEQNLTDEIASRKSQDEAHTTSINSLQNSIDTLTDESIALKQSLQQEETERKTQGEHLTNTLSEQSVTVNALVAKSTVCEQYQQQETSERKEADEELSKTLATQQAAIAALGLRVDGMKEQLITIDEFRAISPKEFKVYYIARDATEKAKLKCWRIYLRSQMIGEFESNGTLTLPVFPMRFPFRFA